MKNTLRILRVVGLTMVLMLAGCGGQQGASGGGDGEPGGGEKPKEYVIGAIVSKTGPASPLGEPEYNTLKLLEKKLNESGGINGVPLRLVLVDDESEPQKAQQEMNRMIHDEKVLAVIGSTTTGASLAMKGIAQENQVPLVSLAASVKVVEPPNEWVFKTPHSDELAAARIWQYLKDKGLTKVAIVHDSNAYGTAGKEALVKLAKDFGIAIVATESYNTKDQDMTVQLTKVKNAGAQAMVVWGTNPGPAIIAKNRKDL
ncbi:MAG: ABC transporter substrate-binding protein, partial [Bacillota bacterium]|nr:ligand-binding receptor [Bacillota bacterium]